ncbi:hypothetical protein [Streptomyces sp. MS1.AVA.4]|uniref:Uncharacterized protein n=1 Tax=Streptomyces pratisoli TaxID=3139917 RepID=A0ACC6QVG0_9ACTN
MTRRNDPREMRGGYQLTMFDTEPEPATTAAPSRIEDPAQPRSDDCSTMAAEQEVDR